MLFVSHTHHSFFFFFFFFQAEDGIRDYKVTGVQTCALPISDATVSARRRADILQLPDIQAHHEQRPRSQTSENLGEVVVQSSGHDGFISNHQQGALVVLSRRTGSRGGGLLIETARPMVQTLRTAMATAPRSTARPSPHVLAVAPSTRTMTACVANAAK